MTYFFNLFPRRAVLLSRITYVNSALVASVKGRGRVGRVGDVAVDGVCHLVTEDRKLVHLEASLVDTIDTLVS